MPRQAITEIAHYADAKSDQAAQRAKLRNDLKREDRVSKFHVLGLEVAEEVGHDVVGARAGSPVHGDELRVEDERRSGGDAQRDALVAVGELGRDLQLPLLPDAHAEDALVPALDDGALAELEVQRLASLVAVAELRPVRKRPAVVHAHEVALVRLELTPLRLEFHPDPELGHFLLHFPVH
jgi:hypothetical protein